MEPLLVRRIMKVTVMLSRRANPRSCPRITVRCFNPAGLAALHCNVSPSGTRIVTAPHEYLRTLKLLFLCCGLVPASYAVSTHAGNFTSSARQGSGYWDSGTDGTSGIW